MIPNDDLDLQVLWVQVLDSLDKPIVNRHVFADAWLKHVAFPWDEYGVAIRNLRRGIKAPYCGSYDNWFKDGLGAAIRSEIWACLAIGEPELAAKYAYEDACIDHAYDGIYAEQFLAALESAAFIENNIDKLLDVGLSVIPAKCRLALAVKDTRQWCAESSNWLAIRQKIIDKWGSENFTDAVMNLPFAVMALLLGKGNFSKTVCLSVNCGRDADCTTATVGAIMGIINPTGIEDKWLKPIGRKLVINDAVADITHPGTLDEFTDQIINLKTKLSLNAVENEALRHLAKPVIAECGIFHPWFSQDENKFSPNLPEQTEIIKFDGLQGRLLVSKIPEDSLFMMRFKFNIDKYGQFRVMFNSPANVRVWIDGKYAFGREGGRMAPSFHRCPPNQYTDMFLEAGEHELVAGVAPLGNETEIYWVMGIGNKNDFQWLPNSF
jgi:ADP-ribosylglycohydrolase